MKDFILRSFTGRFGYDIDVLVEDKSGKPYVINLSYSKAQRGYTFSTYRASPKDYSDLLEWVALKKEGVIAAESPMALPSALEYLGIETFETRTGAMSALALIFKLIRAKYIITKDGEKKPYKYSMSVTLITTLDRFVEKGE